MGDREKRLERALQRIVDETPANEHTKWHHHHWYLVTAREALADDGAGGGEECPSCNGTGNNPIRDGFKCFYCNGTGNNPIRDGFKCFYCNGTGQSNLKEPSFYEREALAKQVPPQHRDALEDFNHIADFFLRHTDNWRGTNKRRVENVRRHLTAPPTVPEAVRRLPDELRSDARKIRSLPGGNYRRGQADAHECISVTLDRALAQHSEPGRVPEAEELARCFHATYECLAPRYGYETRQETREFDPDSNNGRLMIAVCRVIRERFAAPDPDADEGE